MGSSSQTCTARSRSPRCAACTCSQKRLPASRVGELEAGEARAGEGERGHPARLDEREVDGDPPAEREPDEVGALDPQVVEERGQVLGVGVRGVGQVRAAVAARVVDVGEAVGRQPGGGGGGGRRHGDQD